MNIFQTRSVHGEEICLDLVESVFGEDITEDLSTTYQKEIYIYLVDNVTD